MLLIMLEAMSYMYYLSFTNYLLPKCITFKMQKNIVY